MTTATLDESNMLLKSATWSQDKDDVCFLKRRPSTTAIDRWSSTSKEDNSPTGPIVDRCLSRWKSGDAKKNQSICGSRSWHYSSASRRGGSSPSLPSLPRGGARGAMSPPGPPPFDDSPTCRWNSPFSPPAMPIPRPISERKTRNISHLPSAPRRNKSIQTCATEPSPRTTSQKNRRSCMEETSSFCSSDSDSSFSLSLKKNHVPRGGTARTPTTDSPTACWSNDTSSEDDDGGGDNDGEETPEEWDVSRRSITPRPRQYSNNSKDLSCSATTSKLSSRRRRPSMIRPSPPDSSGAFLTNRSRSSSLQRRNNPTGLPKEIFVLCSASAVDNNQYT